MGEIMVGGEFCNGQGRRGVETRVGSRLFMVQSSHVAIAIYLTLCAVLLRCPAMCLLGGWCELRWIAGGMCDPVLISKLC